METTNEQKSLGTPDEKATPMNPPRRGFNRAIVISGFCLAILIGLITFWGIHTRSVDGETLAKDTQAAAIPSVDVVSPSVGAKSYEVVLPASVQGFMDSPVYARTSGYLLHWYADIGTHVKKGQLLADIQTPELDQQVQQGQSDLATAQANYQLAQITDGPAATGDRPNRTDPDPLRGRSISKTAALPPGTNDILGPEISREPDFSRSPRALQHRLCSSRDFCSMELEEACPSFPILLTPTLKSWSKPRFARNSAFCSLKIGCRAFAEFRSQNEEPQPAYR